MSYNGLLTHRCDVYHQQVTTTPRNYGLPGEQEITYPDTPDIENAACLFVKSGQTATITQNEPNNVVYEMFLVHFLKDYDIRIGDKVVWRGIEYTAKLPELVRGHHWEVEVYRRLSL